MTRRTIHYNVETYCLDHTHDGEIVKIGSSDKYRFESFVHASVRECAILYIFRFADGRNIDEKHFYELKIINLDYCAGSMNITLQSDDIILGINHWDGCGIPRLYIFRPYYKRGATGNLTSNDYCGV